MRIEGVEQVKESKYIMLHAPRSALPAIRLLLPGSESPDHHPAGGHARSGGGPRGMPRERVLGNPREPEEGRRQRHAGAAGREDAGLKHDRMQICIGKPWIRQRAAAALARPARRAAARSSPPGRGRHRGGRTEGDRGRCAPDRASSTACSRARSPSAPRSSQPPARSSRRMQIAAIERAIANVEALPRAPSAARRVSLRDRAGRALRAPAARRSAPSACTCPPAPRRCPRPSSCWRCRRAWRGCPTRVLCTPPQRDGARQCRPCSWPRSCAASSQVFKARRRAGDRRHGLWHRERAEGRQDLRARQCLGDGGQATGRRRSGRRRTGHAGGPSEVLVIADDSARPHFVAADLLAQAEHDAAGPGASLLPTSAKFAQQVAAASTRGRWRTLSRRTILRQVASQAAPHHRRARSGNRHRDRQCTTRPST